MAPRFVKNPNKGKKYTAVVPDLPVTYRPEEDEELLREALVERPKLPKQSGFYGQKTKRDGSVED